MREKIKEFWRKNFSFIIPTVATMGYLGLLILLHFEKVSFTIIQESKHFENILETLVTFVSIVLSVFGFLLPSFWGGQENSKTINYFFEHVDREVFVRNLKNIVANGLIVIFITCVLFLNDILLVFLCNVIILVWIWMVFFFMCSSYRYISIIINLLMVEKKEFVQESANEVTEEDKKVLDEKIPRI